MKITVDIPDPISDVTLNRALQAMATALNKSLAQSWGKDEKLAVQVVQAPVCVAGGRDASKGVELDHRIEVIRAE